MTSSIILLADRRMTLK